MFEMDEIDLLYFIDYENIIQIPYSGIYMPKDMFAGRTVIQNFQRWYVKILHSQMYRARFFNNHGAPPPPRLEKDELLAS